MDRSIFYLVESTVAAIAVLFAIVTYLRRRTYGGVTFLFFLGTLVCAVFALLMFLFELRWASGV